MTLASRGTLNGTYLNRLAINGELFVTVAAVLGQSLTVSVGDVNVTLAPDIPVTGEQLTIELGSPVTTAITRAPVTGFQLTFEQGSILIWSEIPPGPDPNWVEIVTG